MTNYLMLEYMLLRGDGRDIFRHHRVRYIVLDEVHTYGGVLGTDVSFLLRRVRAALRASWPDGPAPLFIGHQRDAAERGRGHRPPGRGRAVPHQADRARDAARGCDP